MGLESTAQVPVQRNPLARAVQLDPFFRYYQNRSPESIAYELKLNGYGAAHYIVIRDSGADAKLVEACQKAGVAVWYTTFGNGVYRTNDLPAGWEAWKMRHLGPNASASSTGFTFLCMNHPEYRQWKKDQAISVLSRIPFDGFELMENFWPAFEGIKNPLYGCLCDQCKSAFLRANPDASVIPEFTNRQDPDYHGTNKRLYQKWMDFRAKSVAEFLNDVVNGSGGVRERFPRIKVSVWGIADDLPNGVAKLREWEGIDGGLIAKTVRPDLFVIQTDWPDWMKPELPPTYPLKYKPYVEAIRVQDSKVPIKLQPDVGSNEKCRRGSDWLKKCEAAAKEAGMAGLVPYEFHLWRDSYEAAPKPLWATGTGNMVTLMFNKRIDGATGANLQNYSVTSGKLLSAKVDGNLVRFQVEGKPMTITARNLTDDPPSRFFRNHQAVRMPASAAVTVNWR